VSWIDLSKHSEVKSTHLSSPAYICSRALRLRST